MIFGGKKPILIICPDAKEEERKSLEAEMKAAGFTNIVVTKINVTNIFQQ